MNWGVISIIALLLSILMPSLSVVKERTRRVICGSNQKQLAYSAILYANDYDGKFPLRTDGWDGYFIGYLYFNLGNNFSDWFTWNNAALKMPERTQDPSYIPLFGDQMCLSRSDVNVWRFATHFRDKAAEGRIAPPDLNPEGMNNAMTDGSVHWFKYTPDLQEPIWISGSSDYVYIWGVR